MAKKTNTIQHTQMKAWEVYESKAVVENWVDTVFFKDSLSSEYVANMLNRRGEYAFHVVVEAK